MFHKKIAGDWYGTNSISHVLKSLSDESCPVENFSIEVFHDGLVSFNQVIEAASIVQSSWEKMEEEWKLSLGESGQTFGEGDDSVELVEPVDMPNVDATANRIKDNTVFFNQKRRGDPDESFEHNGEQWVWKNHHVLMIINVWLGLKKIPKTYYDSIRNCFKLKQSVGIIGGKGKMGLYFPGF